MANKQVQTIFLAPFSDKYVKYYNDCLTHRVNCLEGSIRSGKTIINIMAFANYIDYCKYGDLFVVSGKTGGLAYTTVGECKGARTEKDGKTYGSIGGFGLLYLFQGRCKSGEYGKLKCLTITNKLGRKINVVFVGAYNKGAKESLRGLTVQGWLATELFNHRVDDDDDFIDFMFGRLMLSPNYKVFWDLNPTYPTHGVYTKYLDPYEKLQSEGKFSGGYNYVKCNLMDNATLTEDKKEEILSRYIDKNSVSYKRDIEGERACATGLIFGMFAKDKDHWIVKDDLEFIKSHRCDAISIGVDFGGNSSNTTFVASMTYNNKHGVFAFADDKIDMSGGTTDTKVFRERFKQFLLYVISLNYGVVRYVFGDCADPVMIAEIRNVIKELKLVNQIRVENCNKQTIKKRIDCKIMLMGYMCWFVSAKCKNVIKSTETQVWDGRDGHEDERLDNGSVDIDTADAEEYSWSVWLEYLIQYCSKG